MKDIRRLLKDEIIKKIVIFFAENPHSIDTAKGISVWVGCDVRAAQKALNKLAKEGILVNHRAGSTNAYAYSNQRDIVKKIEKLIKKS